MPTQEVPTTMEEKVDNHEIRIKALEDYKQEQEKLNQEIKTQLLATENTVLKESGKQQEMTQKLLDHVLEEDKEDRKTSRDRKTYSQQQFWKVAGLICGSGSVLYLLLENLLTK
ncbi:hypothetical protein M4D71_00735 [Niallia taxi]|uniref:hypothetical protein n=1 Tax=Niallia taxi TaxID=2499688 RepID=UPI0021A44FF2|nr:hypothetical protein [Niallia taxi]MCT2342645.1 hypothetical protein [Niallia taxi]